MCVAIPAKIVKSKGCDATVAIGNSRKQIDTTLVPTAQEGDWVIVHAGFAIQTLSRTDAMRIIQIYENMYEN